jgi:hypothetical protein
MVYRVNTESNVNITNRKAITMRAEIFSSINFKMVLPLL